MKRILVLLTLLAAVAAPALADRDMTGSWAEIQAPAIANPGDTVVFKLFVFNGSPDLEWTREVIIYFPENFDVLDGWYDDLGQDWAFDFSIDGFHGNIAVFTDADGGFGEIYDGTGGEFYAQVYLHENVDCGPIHIDWKQWGDGYGSDPHWIRGELPYVLCVIPTQESSWSTVKSLY